MDARTDQNRFLRLDSKIEFVLEFLQFLSLHAFDRNQCAKLQIPHNSASGGHFCLCSQENHPWSLIFEKASSDNDRIISAAGLNRTRLQSGQSRVCSPNYSLDFGPSEHPWWIVKLKKLGTKFKEKNICNLMTSPMSHLVNHLFRIVGQSPSSYYLPFERNLKEKIFLQVISIITAVYDNYGYINRGFEQF